MDKTEAKKNLKLLEQNRLHLLSYNHLYSKQAFKDSCAAELKVINERMRNIELSLRHN